MSDAQDAAHVAVGELLQRIDSGVMLSRFLLAAEVIDSDGTRAVWLLSDPGSTSWDSLGLIGYAQAVESAAIAAGADE